MNRRPAVTLMEVLIAMFIMAIGMMALLALFPVGAVSMAQALKDDRCAYASYVSENVALATNIRYRDPYVNAALASPTALLNGLVYVDPYGVAASPTTAPFGTPLGLLGAFPGIPRVAPSFVYTPPATLPLPLPAALPFTPFNDRWFSLQDDMTFLESGSPQIDGAFLDRGRSYSYAYLLRRQPPVLLASDPFPNSMYSVQLYAVVYKGRPTVGSLSPESNYAAAGAAGGNGIILTPTPPYAWPPPLKRGGWIFDPINGLFYRVTNYTEAAGTMTVEVQQNLTANVAQITIMDYVSEVFDKGVGWQQ